MGIANSSLAAQVYEDEENEKHLDSIRSHLQGTHPTVSKIILSAFQGGRIFQSPATCDSVLALGALFEPSSAQKQQTNAEIYKVTDHIQREISLNVSRFYVAGPYGRRTTVGPMEIDLVIFLNEQLPPFDKELQLIHSSLTTFTSSLTSASASLTVLAPFEPGRLAVCLATPVADFRIFAAANLGWTPEEQRQACYRHMQEVYTKDGIRGVLSWSPSLFEKPSSTSASQPLPIRNFVRICRFWAYVHKLDIPSYSIETLATIVVGKAEMLHKKQMENGTDISSSSVLPIAPLLHFNPFLALALFCIYISQPEKIVDLCDVLPPAAFIWPWEDAARPVLTDKVNPYLNLLDEVSQETIERAKCISNFTLDRLESEFHLNRISLLNTITTLTEDTRDWSDDAAEELSLRFISSFPLYYLFAPQDFTLPQRGTASTTRPKQRSSCLTKISMPLLVVGCSTALLFAIFLGKNREGGMYEIWRFFIHYFKNLYQVMLSFLPQQ